MRAELAGWVRDEFRLGVGPIACEVGGRGADGEIWRLAVGQDEYAVKRPYAPVREADVRREAEFLDHFAAAGVEVPVHRQARSGTYVVTVPEALGGGQLRASHWVVGEPVGDRAAEVATALGTLLAQLHRAAPPTDDLPSRWYTTLPPADVWASVVERGADEPWCDALVARLGDLAAYARLVHRAGPARGPLLVGHRDLHPDNALVAPDGSLRALDWEDAGPTDPSRELAKVLVQWHVDGEQVDTEAVAATVGAYRSGHGPGRVEGLGDCAMVLCTEANFLAHQAAIACDPTAPPERRGDARADVALSLTSYLPPIEALERVVAAAAG